MRIGSYNTDDFDAIVKSVQKTLVGNTVAIDVVYVPVKQENEVLLGEFEDGLRGTKTLFQADLGMVRWRDANALFESVWCGFTTAFTISSSSVPVMWPLKAESHTSFNGREKLLVYFGLAVSAPATIEAKPNAKFNDPFWVSGTDRPLLKMLLSGIRTIKKEKYHHDAIRLALNTLERQLVLKAA